MVFIFYFLNPYVALARPKHQYNLCKHPLPPTFLHIGKF